MKTENIFKSISHVTKTYCEAVAHKLRGRTIVWKPSLRIYCDGGKPVFRWLPRFHSIGYDAYWGLKGFWVCWLGRQIFFSFGIDKHRLYDEDIRRSA